MMSMSAPRPVSTPPTEAGKADIANLELLLLRYRISIVIPLIPAQNPLIRGKKSTDPSRNEFRI
jgi:hypothetical protein